MALRWVMLLVIEIETIKMFMGRRKILEGKTAKSGSASTKLLEQKQSIVVYCIFHLTQSDIKYSERKEKCHFKLC